MHVDSESLDGATQPPCRPREGTRIGQIAETASEEPPPRSTPAGRSGHDGRPMTTATERPREGSEPSVGAAILRFASARGVPAATGSEDDVLDRYYRTAQRFGIQGREVRACDGTSAGRRPLAGARDA